MSVTSANRLELLQIADAVAREKMIDPALVIEAMEDSLGKAARSRYGAEYDIRAKIDRKTGDLQLTRHRQVVEEPENLFTELTARRGPGDQAGHRARRRASSTRCRRWTSAASPPSRRSRSSCRRSARRSGCASTRNSRTARARSSTASSSAPSTATSSSTSAAARRSCAATS